jgi:hypothetical protein
MRGQLSRGGERKDLPMGTRKKCVYASYPPNFESIPRYIDALRDAAFRALTEEAILVVALQVYHAE